MPTLPRRLRINLQAKVMAAVLTLLIVLPAITLWLVNQSITRQTRDDAGQALTTARATFIQSLGNRNGSLVSRFRNIVSGAGFVIVVRQKDANTMTAHLQALLEEFADDTAVMVFITSDGKSSSAVRYEAKFSPEEFTRAAAEPLRAALVGEIGLGNLVINDVPLNVVAVPVTVTERGQVGVLLAGIRLSETALQQLKPPQTEIMLLANGAVAGSTLRGPATKAAVMNWAANSAAMRARAEGDEIQEALINGEHFLTMTGDYGRTTGSTGFHFILLSSYEQRRDALEVTRLRVLGISAAGIVISALVVWFFIRRVTRPLVELRDSA